MKRGLLLGFTILIAFVAVQFASADLCYDNPYGDYMVCPTIACYDSDSGKVYGEKGTTAAGFGGQTPLWASDCCTNGGNTCVSSGSHVKEYFCSRISIEDHPSITVLSSRSSEIHKCTNGCSGGKCIPTCTSFTYNSWSTCSSSGIQTRTIKTKSPSGCAGGSPVLQRTCTPATVTCTDFTYNLGECINGVRSKSVASSLPSGCTGGSPDLTPESCTVPCTESDWSFQLSECVDSQQTKTWTKTGTCQGGLTHSNEIISCVIGQETCTSFSYIYGECINGQQTKSVFESFPAGCTGGSPDLTPQSCVDTCTDFTYTLGECINGERSKSVASSLPSGCTGGSPDLTPESCEPEPFTFSKCSDYASSSLEDISSAFEYSSHEEACNEDPANVIPIMKSDDLLLTPQGPAADCSLDSSGIQCECVWNNNACELWKTTAPNCVETFSYANCNGNDCCVDDKQTLVKTFTGPGCSGSETYEIPCGLAFAELPFFGGSVLQIIAVVVLIVLIYWFIIKNHWNKKKVSKSKKRK
jgi:hypothetical protein